jgi:cytochrome c-type biogenesis protein CcmE
MKKIYIVAIVVIGIAIFALTSAASDVATYANFADSKTSGTKVKIAGQLMKNKPMVYNPVVDADRFTFYLKDKDGVESKVVLLKAKPQDFELSEQIVVTGEMKNGEFIASDLLMKCPSKYKDEEIYMKKNEK